MDVLDRDGFESDDDASEIGNIISELMASRNQAAQRAARRAARGDENRSESLAAGEFATSSDDGYSDGSKTSWSNSGASFAIDASSDLEDDGKNDLDSENVDSSIEKDDGKNDLDSENADSSIEKDDEDEDDEDKTSEVDCSHSDEEMPHAVSGPRGHDEKQLLIELQSELAGKDATIHNLKIKLQECVRQLDRVQEDLARGQKAERASTSRARRAEQARGESKLEAEQCQKNLVSMREELVNLNAQHVRLRGALNLSEKTAQLQRAKNGKLQQQLEAIQQQHVELGSVDGLGAVLQRQNDRTVARLEQIFDNKFVRIAESARYNLYMLGLCAAFFAGTVAFAFALSSKAAQASGSCHDEKAAHGDTVFGGAFLE